MTNFLQYTTWFVEEWNIALSQEISRLKLLADCELKVGIYIYVESVKLFSETVGV